MKFRLLEDQFDLGEIQAMSVKGPKIIATGRDTTGHPKPSDCACSPPQIIFWCPRLVENQYVYKIQNFEGRIDDVLVRKIEPKKGGFIVSADFLPQ